jgi:flagellar basal-body rod modification protein FlgD
MSAIDALSSTSAGGAGAATGFSALSAGDFTKIILTELSKQDPLQPNDTNALLQQISSVRAIQSDMDLSTKLGDLVNQNQFASAANLIGKTVSGIDDTNQRVSGKVVSLSRTSSGAYLNLAGGQRINVSNLDQILDTTTTPTTPPTNPTPTDPNTTPVGPSGNSTPDNTAPAGEV